MCGCGRIVADKVCKITVLLENSSKVVNLPLKVVLRDDDPSDLVVETSHQNSCTSCWSDA